MENINVRSPGRGLGVSLTAVTPHHLLATPTSFDNAPKIPAKESE